MSATCGNDCAAIAEGMSVISPVKVDILSGTPTDAGSNFAFTMHCEDDLKNAVEGPEYWQFLGQNAPDKVLALYQRHVNPAAVKADLFTVDFDATKMVGLTL